MSVNRYEFEDYGTNEDDGRYVTYEDYAALEARCLELAAENAGMKQAITTHSQSTHFCEVCGKDDPCSTDDVCYVLNETPTTDAFLAEVRAQGVEQLALHMELNGYSNEAAGAREYAANLRKGVQS